MSSTNPFPPASSGATIPAVSGDWLSRWWPHLTALAGGIIAIGVGVADHWVARGSWGATTDLSLVWAGLATLGVTAVAGAVTGTAGG